MGIKLTDTTLIVIDFETLGTDVSNCPVMALGAVIGNCYGAVEAEEEFIFPLAHQFNASHISTDDSTLKFWTDTPNDDLFKEYMYQCFETKESMTDVLHRIHTFMLINMDFNCSTIVAKSPDFDCEILKRLWMQEIGKPWPFKHNAQFDVRSADKLMECNGDYEPLAFKGTVHNALDDAMYEYKNLCRQISYLPVHL